MRLRALASLNPAPVEANSAASLFLDHAFPRHSNLPQMPTIVKHAAHGLHREELSSIGSAALWPKLNASRTVTSLVHFAIRWLASRLS